MTSRVVRVSKRGLLFGLLILLFPIQSWSQGEQVKPYVLLLFDTSGSMIWPVCYNSYSAINGDNSLECPGNPLSCSQCNTFGCGNGVADDSRLYKVKKGAYNVVSSFGEVTFALARFRNVPATFTCNASSNSRVGGWAGVGCNSAVGTNGNQADILVPFSDNNQSSILAWMNNRSDYPSLGSSGSAPNSGCSLCPECGGGCDRELRGVGMTPLAGALYDVRANFLMQSTTGVVATDSKSACRPYVVILLTDGQNTCSGSPTAQAAALNSAADGKSIPVHVIGFGSGNLQTALTAIAQSGGTNAAVIVNNEVSLALAMANIISGSVLKESCNGGDDDCDGLCDETWPEVGITNSSCTDTRTAKTCTAGLGICKRTGDYMCKADGSGSVCSVTAGPPDSAGEICNNSLDDDCDGTIDEGCPPCVVQTEICDGKDNDCDTFVDEGYTPVACGSNIGLCTTGNTSCVAGKVVCTGGVQATSELCDGKDNNCDTIVDLFVQACYPPGNGNGCNTATSVCQGVCKVGSRLCTNGSWGSCMSYQGPGTEVCNGVDDDCDGTIDDGVSNICTNFTTCATYSSCSACLTTPPEICDGLDNDCNGTKDDNPLLVGTSCGTAVGECTKGKWACTGGSLVCQGTTVGTKEICDNKDNDCDGKIDNGILGMGGTCGSSVGECKTGTYKCIGGKTVCSGAVAKGTEICDGLDNDCDGTADNGIAAATCGSDVGECKQGTSSCTGGKVVCNNAVGPKNETCDGLDNDCDGAVDDSPTDEGGTCGSAVGECTLGTYKCLNKKLVCIGDTKGKTEICDGKDNDCNGKTDDSITGTGVACGTDIGECQKGKLACKLSLTAGWSMVCVGMIGAKSEICDMKDNDCDGKTDEEFPQQGQTCGTNIGECKSGAYVCQGGHLACTGSVGSTAEICDGLDNDCNGAIDDKVPGEGLACGKSVGECKPGKYKCVGGKMACIGGTGPSKEICDGKDNDCDGTTDQFAECPGQSKCLEGKCLVPCKSGEFSCPGGSKCVNGYCVPDQCFSVTCKDTERCVKGLCIAKCSGVSCSNHEKCDDKSGQCVDDSCVTKGCAAGKVCVGYKCVDFPCPPGKCPEGEICSDGKCFKTCANVTCPAGQACVKGKCSSDPCDALKCPDNHTCEKGKCVPDLCRLVTCLPGQVCKDGVCLADPCKTTTCPEGFRCKITNAGEADCAAIPGKVPVTHQMLATGAGGCACDLEGGGASAPAGTLLLMLAGLLWFRRRRG